MALKQLNLNPRPRPDPSEASETDAAGPAAAAPSRPDFRKRALPVAGAVAALALVWFAGEWLINGRFEIKTDNAHIGAEISSVAAKVQGYVQDIHVIENQHVKAGDLLFTIEADDYRARAAEAKAALAQAEARVAAQQAAIQTAVGRAASQRDSVAEARANEQAASASAEWSASDLKRLSELADKGWYPKARVEQAQAAERAAKAQEKQAEAAITAQSSQLASTRAAVGQAEQDHIAAQAAVEAARARLQAAELDLGRTQVRAPIDGVITNKMVAQGQLLAPGQITMAVVPTNDAFVVANFKETQVARMIPGQRVYLHVDAYPNLKIRGRVQSISMATGGTFSLIPQDTATGNFTKIVQRVPVRIKLDQDAIDTGLMRSGLAVVATVTTKKSEAIAPEAVLAPKAAPAN